MCLSHKQYLGTIALWPYTSYLYLCAFVTKQYNLMLVKDSDTEAGKVTVGLTMHWPCIIDLVLYHVQAHSQ